MLRRAGAFDIASAAMPPASERCLNLRKVQVIQVSRHDQSVGPTAIAMR